jgi:hypothetical protein
MLDCKARKSDEEDETQSLERIKLLDCCARELSISLSRRKMIRSTIFPTTLLSLLGVCRKQEQKGHNHAACEHEFESEYSRTLVCFVPSTT